MSTSDTTPKFTDKHLKGLKPERSVYRKWDGLRDPTTKGFGIEIHPSGRKVFVLYFTSPEDKKRRYLHLGVFPFTTLRDAREAARTARGQIEQKIDPALAKKRQSQAQKQAQAAQEQARAAEDRQGTVKQLFDTYIADLTRQGKRSARQVQLIFNKDVGPAIGDEKARDVTESDIVAIVHSVAARGALTKANRVLQYLKACFKFRARIKQNTYWAKKAPDFDILINPALEVSPPLKNEPKGERNLSPAEISRLWPLLTPERIETPRALALKLLIATGQRVEEILHAEWSEFDLDNLEWVIPGSRRKKGVEHLVPSTPFHVQLLEEARQYSGDSKLLFPRRDGGPIGASSFGASIRTLCDRAQIERFAPRDCRRTWKTLAGSIGLPLEVRNRIQGHALRDVGSQHYDRYDYRIEKHAAMQKWIAWLQGVADGRDNVVPMERKGGAV